MVRLKTLEQGRSDLTKAVSEADPNSEFAIKGQKVLDALPDVSVGEDTPTKRISRVKPVSDIKPLDSSYEPSSARRDLQKSMIQDAQGELSALDDYYTSRIADQQKINQKNDRNTASISTLTGLAGSTEANVAQQKTTAEGQKAVDSIRAEKALEVATLLGNIRRSALTEAREQRREARLDEQARIEARSARQQEAVDYLTRLSAGGVTANGLRDEDPESYQYLVNQFGSEDAVRGAFVLNTPQDQILDKRIEGGKYVIARQNPLTGEIKIETVDLGLPVGYTKTLDAGDRIVAVPDNWDGDPGKLRTINKGISPSSITGVSNQVIDNERALFGQFRGEPIVKNYNEVVNKKLSVDRIIENGVGGPADLALVFEFMKALDPTSVVRESEYESAAKSGNIFAGTFARFNGYFRPEGGFLPESVQKQFQNLVNQKLSVAQQLYNNVANQYEQIAERQGLNPNNVVLDYTGGLNSIGSQPEIVEVKGKKYRVGEDGLYYQVD